MRLRLSASAVAVVVIMAGTAPLRAEMPKPGEMVTVDPAALPPPGATRSVANWPKRVPRPAGATLALPAGFHAEIFAEGLQQARWLAVAANGDVFLAEPSAGQITLLRDSKGSGKADLVTPFADGFDHPHGMAFHGGFLYVADLRGVWRLPYRDGQTAADGPAEAVTPPGSFGAPQGNHWTRNIAFSPAGDRFYVAIGSATNIDEEPPPRATVQQFAADGSGQRTFASGLRNPVGIAFRPGTDELWAVVNERDGLGDGLVPDYLVRLKDNAFYGWPYSYLGNHPQPGLAAKRPDLVAQAVVPDLLFRSHSAPLGLVFYDGAQFPVDYRGDAFVALHGSWNAAQPTGYMVVRVPFKEGRPAGGYQVFATGFRVNDGAPAEVWGRPVGLAVAKDGSLLVADDVGQTVWRIFYRP
jgi:glucose/arabinose dehydrogenase